MVKEITKSEFDSYESVRMSGVTNMFDTKRVSAYSGLDNPTIIAIMDSYSECKAMFYPSEMELHNEAVQLMWTLNKKYKIDKMASLDEYLDAHCHILEDGDIMTIKTLINKFPLKEVHFFPY